MTDGRHPRVASPGAPEQSAFDPLSVIDTGLDPLFYHAARIGAGSAWWMHVPFAHWIVNAAAPRLLVELGTGSGVSYSAFCQAIANGRLATRCHAVDTWRGDAHAGYYNDDVFNEFSRFHDLHYSRFSTLLRMTFDEARDFFADGSIDLLHIDGFHSYEAVRHDFETWRDKLSPRGVVLFHDINVRERDFGVWRFWEEVRTRYPSFEFAYGYGLGLIAVGEDAPRPVLDLCQLDPGAEAAFRSRFALVGQHWLNIEHMRHQSDTISHAMGEVGRLRAELEAQTRPAAAMQDESVTLRAAIQRLENAAAARALAAATETAALRKEIDRLAADRSERAAAAETAERLLATKTSQLDHALAEVDHLAGRLRQVHQNPWWRLGAPLRALIRVFG